MARKLMKSVASTVDISTIVETITSTVTASPTGSTAATSSTSFTAGQSRPFDLTIAKGLAIYQVTEANSKKFRLRLYSTSAARSADVSRPVTVPLTLGLQHGCILDLYIEQSQAVTPFILSPAVIGFNGDQPTQVTTIYATLDSYETTTQNIAVTIYFVSMES